MKQAMFRQKVLVAAILFAVILLCLFCSLFAIASAEEGEDYTINVVHISDLHYYPTYMCYKQSNANYFDSAMVQKSRLESKLVLESSAVIKKLFADILEKASAANEAYFPDYIVVTGDLSSDGERRALIDIANALRDLQNKIREINPDFQVLVIPGNHDIANQNATDYSAFDGAGEQIQNVTRYEFAKIFSGLGYPDMADLEAELFYAQDILEEENLQYLPYDTITGGFVQSKNASHIQFEYMAEDFSNKNLKDGYLTYVAKCQKNTFIAIDGVMENNVGGRVKNVVFDWLSGKNDKGESIISGKNLISLTHHNVLPHFEMQEQWTKNYLFANFEQTRDFLLSKNVKYNFSGHMHANDVAAFCNNERYNLYDIETGSPVGYGAAYRDTTITFFANGNSDMIQTPRTINNVNADLLIKNGYLTVGQNLDYNVWVNNENIIENTTEYINERLYKTMLEGVLDKVILSINKENFVDYIANFVQKRFENSELSGKIFADSIDVFKVVFGNFYDKIQTQTLQNFEYSGEKQFLQSVDNKLRAYLYNFAKSVFDIQISDGYTLQNMFVDAYTTHLRGGEGKGVPASNANLTGAIEWVQSGELVRAVVAEINDSNTGIAVLLKKVLMENYNLTSFLNADQVRNLNVILAPFSCRLENFNLDKFIKNLAGDKLDSLPSGMVDSKVNAFLKDNIAKGMGENISNVIRSLVTDVSDDSMPNIAIKVRYDENNDEHSHYAEGKVRPATVADGRLPSMLTMTFGEDFALSRNFVWFTDKSTFASDFQICEGDKTVFNDSETNHKFYIGESMIYAVDYPLADLGILTTYTTKEVVRHTFSLNNLKPDTVYSYRVGDKANGWWSGVYTFKTKAETKAAPFEVLITTDIQGISKSTYQNYAKMLNTATGQSENGFDFLLNLGDMVDSGRNANQWQYLLEEGKNTFATMPQVIAVGNHDVGNFKISEGYVPSEGAFIGNYSPIDLHFNMGDRKTYFSYDYSGVHFVVLDTNDIVGDNINFTQLEWLIDDLEANKDNLVVVAMHKGIYSAGPHRNDAEIINMRKTLGKIFSEYKVEIVLQGHDHIYSESFFLDGNGKKTDTPVYKQGAPINNNNGGVLYVTLGSGGDKFYDFDFETDDYINKGKMFHTPTLANPTFGKIVYDGKNIMFYAYEYDEQRDRINQLKMFNDNSIARIVSITTGVIIFVGIVVLIFFLLRSHKKKLEQCKKYNEELEAEP